MQDFLIDYESPGRPVCHETKRLIHAQVPDALWLRLSDFARSQRVSISTVIRKSITKFLETSK
jgi:hypothetical protein